MSLTAADVAEILKLLEESSFDELLLETGDLKLTLRRGAAAGAHPPPPAPRPHHPEPNPHAPAADPGLEPEPIPPPKVAESGDPSLVDVPAPLLGVFYRAPKPGEPPFIELGSTVEADTVIGIIEVMKLMNSVRAGVAGEVAAIPAENGALVEYGETLIRVRPADAP